MNLVLKELLIVHQVDGFLLFFVIILGFQGFPDMGEEVKEKKPNKYVEGFKGFCTFLYNPDDHTVFGRGGSSWGKFI